MIHNLYTTRSIQFLNDSVALLCSDLEYVYPQHPEWYSLDHGFFYLDCKFDNNTGIGTLTFKKMTVIMTGYFNESMTMDEEEPYTVWTFKIDPEGKGIILLDSEEPIFVKEVDPIKGLQWQEFPPANGDQDNPHLNIQDKLKTLPMPIHPK